MNPSLKRFLTILLAISCCAKRAAAVEAVLVADTHVNRARPGANSGTISNFNVGAGYSALLQFDLGTLPRATTAANISRALLRLYCNRVDAAGQINLQTVRVPWGEYTVTFNSMPSTDSPAQSATVTQSGAYVWVDVTTIVQRWVTSPDTNNGLALSSDVAAVQFDSKENDLTGHAPLLDIVLVSEGPKGDTGATGPSGPQGPIGASGPPGLLGATGPQGPKGDTGSVGSQGPAGPQGPQGPVGPTGPAGSPGLNYRGTYTTVTTYAIGDVVILQGTSYVSLAGTNRGNSPISTSGFWGILAMQGATGPQGEAGATGATGTTGVQGPIGPPGPAGPPVSFRGPWSSTSAYSTGDAVFYAGSSYIAVSASSGRTPGFSPSYWSLLAQAGPAGAQGPQGPPGITFKGAWLNSAVYVANDAVVFNGSTFIALVTNFNVLPSTAPTVWSLLAQVGSDGATGPSGSAATINIGTVATGPAGSPAVVTNSGTASAAILNFVIPQGSPGVPGTGGGGGGGTSPIAVQHSVSYTATYYSVGNANAANTETDAVLTWVPEGCTASQLAVFSRQSNRVTVTLRTGSPGNMADSALSCSAANGGSCYATGSVTIPASSFVDMSISGSSGTQGSVWTALSCN